MLPGRDWFERSIRRVREDQVGRRAAAWSPDGKRIATLCDDRKVKFFDSTYRLVMSGEVAGMGGYGPASMAWSPDGRHLAVCVVQWLPGPEHGQRLQGSSTLTVSHGVMGVRGCPGRKTVRDCSARTYERHCHGGGRPFRKASLATRREASNYGRTSAFLPTAGSTPQRFPTIACILGMRCRAPRPRLWSDLLPLARPSCMVQRWPASRSGGVGRFVERPGRTHLGSWGTWPIASLPRRWLPVCRLVAGWEDPGQRRKGRSPWTSDSEDPHQIFHADAEVAKLAWGANNSTLAAGLDNNKVLILEMPSGKVLRTLEREGLEGGIRYLAVLPDGRLVAASGNGAVSVWNSKWETVGDLVRLENTVRQGGDMARVEINVHDGATPAGGTTIAFATSDGIVLWDADKQAIQGKIGTGPMYSVAWSLPLHRLIAAQADRLVIYDVPSGELLASQVIWYGPGKHLFLSPEGHVRCSPEMSEDVVYVALTDDGRQVTLRPAEFAAKYGWKNDPAKIRLSSAAAADKPRGQGRKSQVGVGRKAAWRTPSGRMAGIPRRMENFWDTQRT